MLSYWCSSLSYVHVNVVVFFPDFVMNLDLKLCKGTKVFLDRKNCANISKIEHVLRKFGVIIDEFLSKDVDYIVNDRTFHISNQLEKSRLQEGKFSSFMNLFEIYVNY